MTPQQTLNLTRKENRRAAKVLATRIARAATAQGKRISADDYALVYFDLPGSSCLQLTIPYKAP